MTLIIAILFLLIVSRVAAELAERVGQPAMIGEIVAGLILGPALFGLIQQSPELTAIADIGLLMLVLLAGMEISLDQLVDAFSGRNLWISIMGFVIPFALGLGLGVALGLDAHRTIFVGLCISITALPVSIRILMDLGRLQTAAMSANSEGRSEWRLEGPNGEIHVHVHAPRYVADDLATLQLAVLEGAGATLLPGYMCRQDVEAGRLARVLPDWGPAPVIAHMVFPARRALVPAVRRLIDFLAEHLHGSESGMY